MPTYDYKCLDCNHTFEYFQSMTAELLTQCPECGGALKRVIGTGAGPIFKGSGFYQTDYKDKVSNKTKTESTVTKSDNSSNKKISSEKSNSSA